MGFKSNRSTKYKLYNDLSLSNLEQHWKRFFISKIEKMEIFLQKQ